MNDALIVGFFVVGFFGFLYHCVYHFLFPEERKYRGIPSHRLPPAIVDDDDPA